MTGSDDTLQPCLQPGDHVISWGAVREEYTLQHYKPLAYPAASNVEAKLALRQPA